MKIKEVQISNFRAFKDLKDSTFNFSYDKNETSSLVSIYAPNGFGKTSFYDAVEWGVTGKIGRFDSVGDFEKTRKENKRGGNNNILQHFGAKEKGYVKVITEKETFTDNITGKEYDHKKPPINKFFRDVVLSQEMIDNFLKEQTAEERYNKFVDSFPEITKYNNSYKNIGNLIGYIVDEIRSLENYRKEYEKKQLKIDFELESKKFDEINKAIKKVKSNNDSIDLIDETNFSKNQYNLLTSQVKSSFVSLEESKIKTISKIENIRIVYNGVENDEKNKGIINYIENKRKLTDVEKQITNLKEIIYLLENKGKIQNQIEFIKKDFDDEKNKEGKLNEIEKLIKTFFNLEIEIKNLEKKINDTNQNNIDVENEISILNNQNIEYQNNLNLLTENLKKTQSKLNEFPVFKEKFEFVNNKLEPVTSELNNISNTKSEKERTLEGLKLKINQLNYFENRVDDDLDLLYELIEFKNHKKQLDELKKIKLKINSIENELTILENEINTQNSFYNELQTFINNGLNIINRNNQSDCPLCNQEYESFEQLSNKIISNNLIEKQLKEKLEIKANKEELKKNSIEEYNFKVNEIKKIITNLIQPYKVDLQKLEKEISKLSIQEQEKRIELEIIQKSSNEVSTYFENNNDIVTFEEELKSKINNLKKQISTFEKSIKENSTKLNEKRLLVQSNHANIEILKKSISNINNIGEFKRVKSFFKNDLSDIEISNENLLFVKSSINSRVTKLLEELEINQKKLKEILSKLSNYKLTINEYSKKLEEIEKGKTLILKVIDYYENFIKSEFVIDLKDKQKEEIEKEFNELISELKINQSNIESLIENYKIIDSLKEDCLTFSELKIIQNEIVKIKENLAKYESAKEKLVIEKEHLEDYLEKTIDEFFYTDLINAIYKKIDPHPDYDSVEFKCEFGENKPRLQVFTIKKDKVGKKIKSIPALYFSTAQINILSLSIFLARALKAKDDSNNPVDCIFIDDPIQSMDSINILSFIDLFRGIITSLGKQLIVSTHEENFHLLLQKKIPKELFKSKFIEFETFGKLKQEIAS